MRRIYTLLLYLILPFIILRLYWKSRKFPAYRERIMERFSLGQRQYLQHESVDVWIHAVSLGEIIAATPFIEALLHHGQRILLTSMTPTGSKQALLQFSGRISHQYLPYDYPWAIRHFFQRISPRMGIIMETELWPNLIFEAKRANIPLLLANARISDKAFKQYKIIYFLCKNLLKNMLKQLNNIFAQSHQDAERFIALGASTKQLSVVGNLKFDAHFDDSMPSIIPPIAYIKKSLKKNHIFILAASTHHNEEEQLLNAFQAFQKNMPDVVLCIAPRHPERFQTVHTLSQQLGFNTGRRSILESIHESVDVVILDSIGELISAYQISDYAFVGGSFIPIGGHNVLEPIAMQVPVFVGPYMQNSKSIYDALTQAQAIQTVPDASALMQAIYAFHQDPNQKIRQMANANKILAANQGSLARHLDMVLKHLTD